MDKKSNADSNVDSSSDDGDNEFSRFASNNRFCCFEKAQKKTKQPDTSTFDFNGLRKALKEDKNETKPVTAEQWKTATNRKRSGSSTANGFGSSSQSWGSGEGSSGFQQSLRGRGRGRGRGASTRELPPRFARGFGNEQNTTPRPIYQPPDSRSRSDSMNGEVAMSVLSPPPPQPPTRPFVGHCPFTVRYICHTCFKIGGSVVYQNGTYCGSRNTSHTWEAHKGFAIFDETGKAFVLRDLPKTMVKDYQTGKTKTPRTCHRMERYNKCNYDTVCGFAHNDLERRCWMWMLKKGHNSVSEIVSQHSEGPSGSTAPRKQPIRVVLPLQPAGGRSWSSVLRSAPPAASQPSTIPAGPAVPPGFTQRTVAPPVRPQPTFGARGAAASVTSGARPRGQTPITNNQRYNPADFTSTRPQAQQIHPAVERNEDLIISFYCYLCDKTLQDEYIFDDHVANELHQRRYNLVEESHLWKYRTPLGPPPYRMCSNHLNGERCEYSKFAHNYCSSAHSPEELSEWTERLEILQRGLNLKSNEEMLKLKKKIEEAAKLGKSILTPCRDDIDVNCEGNQQAAMVEQGKPYEWKFSLVSEKRLRRVMLLAEDTAKYFRFRSPHSEVENQDVVLGDVFGDDTLEGFYEVHIRFVGSPMSHTFTQRVAFDFGDVPILYRELTIHCGIDQNALVEQNSLRYLLARVNRRWSPENAEIIWVSNERSVERMDISNVVANLNFSINEFNYYSLLKQWMFAEEYKQQSILDELEMTNIRITILDSLIAQDGERYRPTRDGALFAMVPFKDIMTEDMDAVTLLREYCQHAFIALTGPTPSKMKRKTVYEVDMVTKFHMSIDGFFADHLFLQLSSIFVRHKYLSPGMKLNVDIQFNLATKQIRQQLRGLEVLKECQLTPLIFPDLLAHYRDYVNGKVFEECRAKIPEMRVYLEHWKRDHNAEQHLVLEHVVACAVNPKKWAPPLVVFGPFGTGKTRTMASAAATLLTNKNFQHTRILICTHANTTADIYINLLLQHTKMSTEEFKRILWRVFHRHAKPERNEFVRSEWDSARGVWRAAKLTLEALRGVRVLICTFSSSDKLLKVLGTVEEAEREKVAFTHIFIDEAAQALEVETVLPLCVARRSTCVVVAGDHHQIRPTVHLPQAKELSQSYLERLYYHYDKQKANIKSNSGLPPRIPSILFNKNYRCHPDILSFLSSEFYGDSKCLVTCSNWPSSNVIKPLCFVVSDSDENVGGNGLISNPGEALVVAGQVEFLLRNWPPQWGEVNIGVAVPYAEQGNYIRDFLRNRHIYTSQDKIDVSRVIQMQGKEYKALVISTVRAGSSLLEAAACSSGDHSRNLGFLEDNRLINTAMTRAKYTVITVGNPSALCAIGACRDTWYRYVETCARNNCLYNYDDEWYKLDRKIGIAKANADAKLAKKNVKTSRPEDLLLQQLNKKSQGKVK